MTGMHSGPEGFVSGVGRLACDSARMTARGIYSAARAAVKCTKDAFEAAGKSRTEKEKAPSAPKTAGERAAEAVNVLFPAASLAVLAMTVSSTLSTDYGVAVEYEGEKMGIVSGEDALSEAQCTVADRIRYYDTKGDCSVTASLSITPLLYGEDVTDPTELARNIESVISQKYDEIPPEPEEEPLPDPEETILGVSNKIKAYAVRVDGEFIGAVEGYSDIAAALEEKLAPYRSEDNIEVCFDREIVYDKEEYVYPNQIVPQENIINDLTGVVSQPEYYEVKDGDYLLSIAREKNMTLEELSSCYATYNGKVVENFGGDVLKTGTLIRISSEVSFLQVECRSEADFVSDIPFETITVEDPELPAGQIVIETQGETGGKRTHAIVTYRGDTPVKKDILETVVYKEPVAEVIRMGTMLPAIDYNVPEFIQGTGNGEYIWPVAGGYISAHQGDGRNHKGLDIAAPYGTPIYAAASGTVIASGTGWNGGYGNRILIQNDDGKVTMYAHQSELVAQLGDVVEAGQLIGYVGSTGQSTGNHLHFEVRLDGKYLNPEEYVCQ